MNIYLINTISIFHADWDECDDIVIVTGTNLGIWQKRSLLSNFKDPALKFTQRHEFHSTYF